MDAVQPDAMRRFVLDLNIQRLTQFICTKKSIDDPDYFHSLIRHDRRELAILNAAEYGAFEAGDHISWVMRRNFDPVSSSLSFDENETDFPAMIIDPRPGLKILNANRAYEMITGKAREQMMGRPVYEVFPENPAASESEYTANTLFSLTHVVKSGKAHIIPVQRYDICNADGDFSERYWRIENAPIFCPQGKLACIHHIIEDITDTKSAGYDAGRRRSGLRAIP